MESLCHWLHYYIIELNPQWASMTMNLSLTTKDISEMFLNTFGVIASSDFKSRVWFISRFIWTGISCERHTEPLYKCSLRCASRYLEVFRDIYSLVSIRIYRLNSLFAARYDQKLGVWDTFLVYSGSLYNWRLYAKLNKDRNRLDWILQ